MTDEQDAAIAFLSRPETFGVVSVERVETHASMVFLAGDRVYKLKKAVRYSYLDYSTLELRHAACDAELRINRRFSPDLYLKAAPIVRAGDGQLRLDGQGDPVDWVVVMRRFPADDQLDLVAERGGLTPLLAWQLADRIAAVHDAAEPCPSFGGAEGLGNAIRITIDNLRLATERELPAGDVNAWSEEALRRLEDLTPLLERRRRDGRVRACHGDLHLANLCLVDGKPTLFDAIEFDPAISSIDVLYDLAFLLMDLRHRGFDQEANLIFNRYLDRRDEADGIAALPLFLSLRAAIRAQVTIAASQHRRDEHGPRDLLEKARSYLTLALRLLARQRPRMIAIGGFSGTGKSTLAQRLAPFVGAVPGARVLRSDVLRKRAAGVAPETRLPPEAYSAESHRDVYRILGNEAVRCLEGGHAVIVDAVFGRDGERASVAKLAREAGAPFEAIWLDAPLATLERRVDARKGDPSDATVEVVRNQVSGGEVPSDWTIIDAGRDPDQVLIDAARALQLKIPSGIRRQFGL